MSGPEVAAPPARRVRYGVLAGALLSLELVAGVQSVLLSTVVPVVAQDLDAHEYYGVIVGSAQVAMFLTMPLGPALLQRFRVDRVLLHLTTLAVAGGVASALAPSTGVFVLGRAATGLASGALATVSLAAIVTVLPPAWRRGVLAGYNVMWVAISLVGPLYAGWVTAALSWRWALVLYLPLLVVARLVVARQLSGRMRPEGERQPLGLGSAAVLATGVALLSVVGLRALPAGWAVAAGVGGAAVALVATRRLLPAGTLRARPGRPAAVATFALVCAAYFGASGIVAVAVHDLLGGTTRDVVLVLGGSALGWAVAGLGVSRWPAALPGGYVRRSALGAVLLAAGVLVVAAAVLADPAAPRVGMALAGWAASGVGIGLVYLETLNRVVEAPREADGITVPQAAAAVVIAESVATAVTQTLGAASVGRGVAGGGGQVAAVAVLVGSAVLALAVLPGARRAVRGPAS